MDYDIFEKLEEEIIKYRVNGNVIVGGDLNAKTNTESDFVSDHLDDHSPVNDVPLYKLDKASNRKNRDK